MLPSAQVPSGVSTVNCLAWSKDGELAVAAGEEVYILIPRHIHSNPWTLIHIRVNTFTFDEWPERGQASFADLAIGEEQSKISIVSLAWSPTGLAKHGRCVLAILTSNLLLSLWAPGPDAINPTTWERVFIFNDTAIPSHISTDSSPTLQRIRCMSWAPVAAQHIAKDPSSNRKDEIAIIAIADGTNRLCFLEVYSPFNCQKSTWDVKLLTYKALAPLQRNTHRISLLQAALSARQFIDRIDWGGWDQDNHIVVRCYTFGGHYKLDLFLSLGPPIAVTISDQVEQVDYRGIHTFDFALPASMETIVRPCRLKYAEQHHLRPESVSLRTWGTASFDNILATCVTFHPKEMLEYQVPAEASAVISFRANDVEGDCQPDNFPWQQDPVIEVQLVHQSILKDMLNPTVATLDSSGSGYQPLQWTEFDRNMVNVATYTLCPDRNTISLQELYKLGLDMSVPEMNSIGLCPFCEGDVTLDTLLNPMEARCVNGHAFGTFSIPWLENISILANYTEI